MWSSLKSRLALCGLACLCSAAAEAATCPSYPNTLTNGTTADATQVMANFNSVLSCANTSLAPIVAPHLTGVVTINTPSPSTGTQLSVTPSGNDWNEGIEINPSTADGAGLIALRSTANSVVGGWALFNANSGDASGTHSLGIALNGLAGMSGTGRADTPFSITTAGVSRFGGPVGIGATDPNLGGVLTSVFTAVSTATAIAAAYNTSTPSFAVNPASNGGWAIYDHGQNEWRVDLEGLDGAVGVGGATGSTLFYVNGTAGGPSAWQVTSDFRLKTKIRPIRGALDVISKLQGVRYEWKPPAQRTVAKTLPLPLDAPQVGFIAQDVAKIVPEAVAAPKAGPDGVYSLKEDNLIPFLVEAIKEQQAEIVALRAEVAAMKSGAR